MHTKHSFPYHTPFCLQANKKENLTIQQKHTASTVMSKSQKAFSKHRTLERRCENT